MDLAAAPLARARASAGIRKNLSFMTEKKTGVMEVG
jgi:hypothetical protein